MSTPKVILITGASGGIGRACAVALSKAFAPLVLVLSGRREAELQATAAACAPGTTVEVVAGDVSDEADVRRMFELVQTKYGRLDVLFNNAGVDLLNSVPIEDADMATFRKVLDVNVMAAVQTTAAAVRIMKAQSPPGGRIINNGSISSESPRPDSAAYTVSKHAILGLTRSTSLDGRKYGIAATQLDIGNAQTDMGGHAAKGCRQADGSIRPEPMMGVKNVADTVVFVAGLPLEADVQRLSILATGMPFVGRG
ncbi:3-beta-hydroxycholanate 3-dehydrogenase (NADP(+)) [Vanrija pseudolonga]|uniref:3-beta-hydroxycholanate 3-dehydrogenase (NADP(+)) n=1 Tax=Vanrija pseudolonga TaxID=143232 RepID=A0AAF0YD70_9TREE|nr:3-beta-hydroxycholanate 3-dehydrogenase (NADP(+)) [Vanrija pseudolonga]